MWDGDKYVDLFGKYNVKSDIKAASMFYSMMLDGEKHYKHLIEKHILNPGEFASPYGMATTSRDDPSYAPERGVRLILRLKIGKMLFEEI